MLLFATEKQWLDAYHRHLILLLPLAMPLSAPPSTVFILQLFLFVPDIPEAAA